MQKLHKVLKDLNACKAAIKWAGNRNVSKASWDACERGDWMLWLAAKIGIDRKLIVAPACDIVADALNRHWHDIDDDRPAECIRVTRLWIKGEASVSEVYRARERTAYAADAAYFSKAVYAVAAIAVANAAIVAAVAAEAVAAVANANADATAADDTTACRYDSFKHSAVTVHKHIPFNIIKDAIGKM